MTAGWNICSILSKKAMRHSGSKTICPHSVQLIPILSYRIWFILWYEGQKVFFLSFDTRIAPLLCKSTLCSCRRRADIYRISCTPQFYIHSESVDFPGKITGASIKDWWQFSCVWGSICQRFCPARWKQVPTFWPLFHFILSCLILQGLIWGKKGKHKNRPYTMMKTNGRKRENTKIARTQGWKHTGEKGKHKNHPYKRTKDYGRKWKNIIITRTQGWKHTGENGKT